jgi:hypothetical protein
VPAGPRVTAAAFTSQLRPSVSIVDGIPTSDRGSRADRGPLIRRPPPSSSRPRDRAALPLSDAPGGRGSRSDRPSVQSTGYKARVPSATFDVQGSSWVRRCQIDVPGAVPSASPGAPPCPRTVFLRVPWGVRCALRWFHRRRALGTLRPTPFPYL